MLILLEVGLVWELSFSYSVTIRLRMLGYWYLKDIRQICSLNALKQWSASVKTWSSCSALSKKWPKWIEKLKSTRINSCVDCRHHCMHGVTTPIARYNHTVIRAKNAFYGLDLRPEICFQNPNFYCMVISLFLNICLLLLYYPN